MADCPFGRGVDRTYERLRHGRRYRTGNDKTPATLALHLRHNRPQGQKYGGSIGGEDLLPDFEREVFDRAGRVAFASAREEARARANARVGKHDIELSIPVHNAVECPLERFRLRDVRHFAMHLRSPLFQPSHRFVKCFFIHVNEGHASAVDGHYLGVSQTNAAGCSGDRNDQVPDIKKLG